MNITKENLKDVKIEDIIAWCQENGQVAWLKACAAEMVEQKVYPTVTYFDKDGKERTKQDKKAEPIGTEMVKKPYVSIKFEWVQKFFPELVAKKEKKAKKPTMWEVIANL